MGGTYAIEFEPSAFKALRDLPTNDQRRVVERIEALATDPRPPGVEKLKGQADAYRVRQGDCRIIYTVDDTIRVLTITRVGHRRDVYKKK